MGLPLADLPLEPALGRCLLASCGIGAEADGCSGTSATASRISATASGCSEEMLTIAAMLSVPHIWVPASGAQRALDEQRGRFGVAEVGAQDLVLGSAP